MPVTTATSLAHPLFSWQIEAWQHLQSMRNKMPHAILLHGAQGIGKSVFAEHLAQSLLCESPAQEGHACGTCPSCLWFVQYSHPDYRRVRPGLLDEEEAQENAENAENANEESEKKSAKASKAPSKEIVIDQVRALSNFMNTSTHRNGRRVVVLYPAEALNTAAANAILKSLEEPNPNTVFILMTHRLDKLLPTILSRCHKLSLPMPSQEQGVAWLQEQNLKDAAMWLAQQGGSPLLALQVAQSDDAKELDDFLQALAKADIEVSLKLADKMQKMEMPRSISWMQRWLYDIFSLKQSGKVRYYPKYQAELGRLAARCNNVSLLAYIDNIKERQLIANHPLSAKLFLEDMLLEYTKVFKN